MYFTSNDGSQTMLVHQPTLNTWELKKDKRNDYVLSWKSKGIYTTFLHRINLSGYRIRIKFDKNTLPVEQNNYLTKIVNVYIVYDLDAWLRNRTNNFKFKNWLFGATNIGKIVFKRDI